MVDDDDFSATARAQARGMGGSGPLLSLEDAARHLGVSPSWVRQRVRERDIPYVRLGRLLRFRPEDLEAWLDRTQRTRR